jgi:hypothetical protein
MSKAAQRYPAQAFAATVPLTRVMACANSNQLATDACLEASAGYEITLPSDKVPTGACSLHGGLQTQLAQGLDNLGRKAEALPNRVFRSFRKFFGGR